MKIHTTIGIYSNGERKINGVSSEFLQGHIKYNLDHRPGRAFFVDGLCLNQAHLTPKEVDKLSEELKTIIVTKDTVPYQ
jgi:hypothetical protein